VKEEPTTASANADAGITGPPPVVSIVVPCYREEEALAANIPILTGLLADFIREGIAAPGSEIVFVDDGSSDGTWDAVTRAHAASPRVRGVSLAANSGHQNALLAGFAAARGDFVISIDADLQDDVSVMRDMIQDGRRGIDIVYGVRRARDTDTFFKRFTAESFYRVMRLFGVNLVFNHADYRGMSRRALQALLDYPEKAMFLRGIVAQIGFRTSRVYYARKKRTAGESKYPLTKMAAFAVSGITSFSFAPLRMVTLLGLALFLLSFCLVAWILWIRFATDRAVPGWASSLFIQSVFGGIQLLCLGIIGEYLAIIFKEVKNRPRYHVKATTDDAPPEGVEGKNNA